MTTQAVAYRHSPWPGWYGVFAHQVYTMWQRKLALPEEKAVGHHITTSRGMRKLLSHTGLVVDQLPPLAQQAHATTKTVGRSMEGKQAVVVYDNWYCKRYCNDLVRPDCCLNVNAMLVLHTTV